VPERYPCRLLLVGLLAGLLAAVASCGPAPSSVGTSPTEEASRSVYPATGGSPTGSPSAGPAASRLLFAVKEGTEVSVLALDRSSGAETVLLRYRERTAAERSGNYWEELAPSVARTRDGRLVAYTADDGLHLLDLSSGARRSLLARLTPPPPEERRPPVWSPSPGEGVHAVLRPSFSPDARFLAFEAAHYEGSSIWLYDLAVDRLVRQDGLPEYSYADPVLGSLAWAPAGATSVVPENGPRRVGVVVSAAGDPSRAAFRPVRAAWIAEAAVAADGALVAVAAGEEGAEPRTLGVVEEDGRLGTLEAGAPVSSPTFDPEGALWWVSGERLVRWHGSEPVAFAGLEPGFRWRIAEAGRDAVALVGRDPERGRGRLLLLDALTGRTLAAHDAPTEFIVWLGLA
jgi:hypothetical protein